MRISISPLLLAFFLLLNSSTLHSKDFFETSDQFFKSYVKNGQVNYKAIQKNIASIEVLYNQIGKENLSNKSDLEIQAFYINAYNLIVIYWVAKHYPLKSPLDNSGFFDKVSHQVAGESMTLNALEIKKLLATYKDPRFHFALACAAVSCPPLANFAYRPEQLDQQLEQRTKISLNDDKWLKVDYQKNQVAYSKIFQWYKKDFLAEAPSITAWVNNYREKDIPTSFKESFYEYDWSLNEM